MEELTALIGLILENETTFDAKSEYFAKALCKNLYTEYKVFLELFHLMLPRPEIFLNFTN